MQAVWFLFKLLETLLGFLCMGFHVRGFLNIEDIKHNLFYCGTFCGFTLMAIFGNISIVVGSGPSPLVEAVMNACAAMAYIAAAILSMYQAEKDFHLMYLSDFEEPLHPFFRYSKAQSISALANGALHLLHSIFAFDVILIPDKVESVFAEDEIDARQPIQLYVLGKEVQDRLQKFRWFRRIAGWTEWID